MKHYVWDVIIRLCHFVFIGGCIAAWVSYETGAMAWHIWSGYAVLTALLVRLIWGFLGSENARFSSFVRSPSRVWRYLRNWMSQPASVGHNPLGGYSVLALLLALLMLTVTGLFSDDEVVTAGPLRAWASDDVAESLTHLHGLIFDGLLALLCLHLTAIALYAVVKRTNLVSPMITGWKRDLPASPDSKESD